MCAPVGRRGRRVGMSEQSEKIYAPFTPEQVRGLNEWQRSGWVHPFTCVNRDDGNHVVTNDLGSLIAAENGWYCDSCPYVQDWAWEFMTHVPDNPLAAWDTIQDTVVDNPGF